MPAIIVSNISAEADENDIREFFNFCGPIKKIMLRKTDDADSQEAEVYFESQESCRTALLLSNGIILDAAITVQLKEPSPGVGPQHSTRPHSKFSEVLANSILALRSFDERNKISESVRTQYDAASTIWKTSGAKTMASSISNNETVVHSAEAIKSKTKEAADKALQVESIARVCNAVASGSHLLGQRISAIKEETNKVIEEREAECSCLSGTIDEQTALLLTNDQAAMKGERKSSLDCIDAEAEALGYELV